MEVAFEKLKKSLASSPVLEFPYFGSSFVVETDASSIAIGGVILQEKEDGNIHLIQSASRTMTVTERNYST